MKTVAISKLKASLSKFLAMVKAGEEVLVTDRGKPVARISPVQGNESMRSSGVIALEKAGSARIGTGSIPDAFWKLSRPVDKKSSALKALLDERSEGR